MAFPAKFQAVVVLRAHGNTEVPTVPLLSEQNTFISNFRCYFDLYEIHEMFDIRNFGPHDSHPMSGKSCVLSDHGSGECEHHNRCRSRDAVVGAILDAGLLRSELFDVPDHAI